MELFGRFEKPGTKPCKCPSTFQGKYFKSLGSQCNPRRIGSWGWQSHNIILLAGGCIAAAEFFALGGRPQDIRWDIKHGFAAVTDGPSSSHQD